MCGAANNTITVGQVDGSDYKVHLSTIAYNKYATRHSSGTDSIVSNNPARKWFKYLERESGDGWQNTRAVAFLLDTELWSNFAGNDAEYAIGAPTLDLLVASYNNLNDRKLEFMINESNQLGYRFRLEGDRSWVVDRTGLNQDGPYTTESTKATRMWIASPSANKNHKKLYYYSADATGGHISDTEYTSTETGLRPIVCLKATAAMLEENGVLSLI